MSPLMSETSSFKRRSGDVRVKSPKDCGSTGLRNGVGELDVVSGVREGRKEGEEEEEERSKENIECVVVESISAVRPLLNDLSSTDSYRSLIRIFFFAETGQATEHARLHPLNRCKNLERT